MLGSAVFAKKQQWPCRVRLHCAYSPLSWRIMDCQFLSPASRYRKESKTSCFFEFTSKGLNSKLLNNLNIISKPGMFLSSALPPNTSLLANCLWPPLLPLGQTSQRFCVGLPLWSSACTFRSTQAALTECYDPSIGHPLDREAQT